MPRDSPAAEVDVTVELVRSLLSEQHADLADLPIELVTAGWDNAIFRLGDELAVRLPRRQLAVALVDHEQRWLPELAPRLPLPIPVPLRHGRPGHGFPWKWSVLPWLRGEVAISHPPADLAVAARQLGEFVAAMRQPAPADAPPNPFRGVPLDHRRPQFVDNLDALRDTLDADAVQALWSELVETPPWHGPGMWLHGDLHPANLLVADGKLSAVIDFGDITSGDPATDLGVAWMMFPADVRSVFRDAAGDIDDDTWARGRAWALAIGLACMANSADRPVFADLGRRTVTAALAG